MFDRNLKINRSLIRSIVNNNSRYTSQLEGEVAAPLRNIVDEINGGVWKGQGADRFADWMTSQVTPMLLTIIGLNVSFGDTLLKVIDRMDEAEQSAFAQLPPFV
jgi:hypothetical protein